jgi:hypothetical protein
MGPGMPIYRLEPVRGAESHHFWNGSLVPPVTVWVEAMSPGHARRRMQGAAMPPATGPMSSDPWTDTALVRCIEDASRSVPRNTAVLANGQIMLKLQDGVGQS